MISVSTTMSPSFADRLRGRIREHGCVPVIMKSLSIAVACPACGRQMQIRQRELGAEVQHGQDCASVRKRCGARFVLDEKLRGYTVNGKRIGLEEWENAGSR